MKQKLTGRIYDVTKTLWRHSFYSNANLNKSTLQILLLDALYPLDMMYKNLTLLWSSSGSLEELFSRNLERG